MTNSTTVIGTVIDQVIDHFLAREHPVPPVYEGEPYAAPSLNWSECVGVILQPAIRLHESVIKLFQLRKRCAVRRVVRVGGRSQSRSKEFLHANHVIQLLTGEGKACRMVRAIDLGHCVQRSPVGPSLVFQWELKEHEMNLGMPSRAGAQLVEMVSTWPSSSGAGPGLAAGTRGLLLRGVDRQEKSS